MYRYYYFIFACTKRTPMAKQSIYIMKSLYRKDRFIKDLPSSDMYKRMLYLDCYTNDDIILLETLMQLQKIHGANFIHSFGNISMLTRLTRRKYEKARSVLVDKNIISYTVEGYNQPNKFTVNIKWLCSNLQHLYDFNKLDKKDVNYVMNDIRKWLDT